MASRHTPGVKGITTQTGEEACMNGNHLPKDRQIPVFVIKYGWCHMKVIRKVLSTWEQENNSLKSTNFLQLQLQSLGTERVSQIFSLTFGGPVQCSASVIQRGHRCETQLQPLVPDSSSQPRLHCLRKLSYEHLHYTLTIMDEGEMPKRIPPTPHTPKTSQKYHEG